MSFWSKRIGSSIFAGAILAFLCGCDGTITVHGRVLVVNPNRNETCSVLAEPDQSLFSVGTPVSGAKVELWEGEDMPGYSAASHDVSNASGDFELFHVDPPKSGIPERLHVEANGYKTCDFKFLKAKDGFHQFLVILKPVEPISPPTK